MHVRWLENWHCWFNTLSTHKCLYLHNIWYDILRTYCFIKKDSRDEATPFPSPPPPSLLKDLQELCNCCHWHSCCWRASCSERFFCWEWSSHRCCSACFLWRLQAALCKSSLWGDFPSSLASLKLRSDTKRLGIDLGGSGKELGRSILVDAARRVLCSCSNKSLLRFSATARRARALPSSSAKVDWILLSSAWSVSRSDCWVPSGQALPFTSGYKAIALWAAGDYPTGRWDHSKRLQKWVQIEISSY